MKTLLKGRAVWIVAVIMLAGYFLSVDIVTPEEKAALEFNKLSAPMSNAAGFVLDCERRIANRDQPGSYLRRQDLAACEAGFQKFRELFENAADESVAKLCGPDGYLALKSKDDSVFEQACSSRML